MVIMESHRNGAQLSSRHDDDDDEANKSADKSSMYNNVIQKLQRLTFHEQIVCYNIPIFDKQQPHTHTSFYSHLFARPKFYYIPNLNMYFEV